MKPLPGAAHNRARTSRHQSVRHVACRKVGSPRQARGITNSARVPWRRKGERVSESELHGTVNYALVALLTRGGESSRVVGPSIRVVHGDRQSRRSFEQNPSLSHVGASELGHVVRRSVAGRPRRRCQLARLYQEGEPVSDGQQRIVDQAKAQGNAWDTGVVPGHRTMELNSTTAEEVKVMCCSRSYG